MPAGAFDHRLLNFFATTMAAMNFARLDLVSIRLVVLCADLGSLTAGAKAANLSISGASHRIAKLEICFGVRLFDRHRRGLNPTAAGQAVTDFGRQLIDSVDQLVRVLPPASAIRSSRQVTARKRRVLSMRVPPDALEASVSR
jgi:molybdate transport repressor ModE-like protein